MVYKFQCELCNESCYRGSIWYIAVRSGISLLTNKKVQPRKDSTLLNHSLNCIYSPSFEDFGVLYNENKKFFYNWKRSSLYSEKQIIKESKHTPAQISEYCKIFQYNCSTEHVRRLLLKQHDYLFELSKRNLQSQK